MSKDACPIEERERLAEIDAVDLEAARPGFERIARLTQCLSHTPLVHIGLVQADTLWLAGVSDRTIPTVAREHAFADVVMNQGDLLWVEDASRDDRFKANPFVTGPHRFRFYAGAPIHLSNGRCIGALSIIDRKPRAFDPFLAERLGEFAALVADDWERRRVLSLVVEREAEARAANEILASVVEVAPVALAMTDRDFNIVRSSARWRERASNWVEGELTGVPIYEIAPRSRAVWEVIRDRCMQGEDLRTDRARFVSPDGVARWVRWEITSWRDPKGEFGGLLVMVHEITDVIEALEESERSEHRLKLANELAESANRAKNEFLANMSHEIRTPLNGVMGVAGALSRTRLEVKQREMVELIESSALVLENLLSDVLDIARIESGRLDLVSEPFDLAASLRGVAALFEPKAAEKGLAFETLIAPAAEVLVCGDAVRLRQIVSNLLSNAVKFTEAGKVSLQVDVTRSLETASLRLCVRDSGIGFDAAAGARLFKRFEQADGSITRRFGGTGLGLAISRSIAEAMGGTLEAVAEPGRGAAFTLTVELPRARGESPGARVSATPTAEAEPMTDAPRVLLAEDHPTNRKVVALILEAVGVDLIAVEHGQAAVEAVETQDFDVILMDMQMPVMDGLTAIRLIRARERAKGLRRTPILALTANAMPEHARASADAGADGHLSKPIAAAKLVEAVREAFEAAMTGAPLVIDAEPRSVASGAQQEAAAWTSPAARP